MALQPLRSAGQRILFYLDNVLLLAPSKQEAASQTEKLTSHLSMLGFSINWEKSSVVPSQLGLSNHDSAAITTPKKGSDDIVGACQTLQIGDSPDRHASLVVPLGLFHKMSATMVCSSENRSNKPQAQHRINPLFSGGGSETLTKTAHLVNRSSSTQSDAY